MDIHIRKFADFCVCVDFERRKKYVEVLFGKVVVFSRDKDLKTWTGLFKIRQRLRQGFPKCFEKWQKEDH